MEVEYKTLEEEGVDVKKDSSFSFTVALLPENPMVGRVANDQVGFFTTAFTAVGRIQGQPAPRHLQKIRLINRRRPTQAILYYIDPSVPVRFRAAIKLGVEKWNLALTKTGSMSIRAVLPSDADFPKDYDASDIRYSSISWAMSLDKVYAIGPATVDPRSGEILNTDIVFTHGWVNSWLGELLVEEEGSSGEGGSGREDIGWRRNEQNVDGSIRLEPNTHRQLRGCHKQQHVFSTLHRSLIDPSDALLKAGLTDVTMHEVGHTLGLRHNFKGSMATPFDKIQDAAYLTQHGLSASVMDYLPLNIPDPAHVDPSLAFSSRVGSYDMAAIQYGYDQHLDLVTLPFSSPEAHQVYVEMSNAALQAIAAQAGPFGTDEDGPGFLGEDYANTAFDLSAEPLKVMQEELRLVGVMQKEDQGDQVWEDLNRRQLQLLSKVLNVGLGAAKFVGGVTKTREKQTEGSLQVLPFEDQALALSLVFASINGTFEGVSLLPSVARLQKASLSRRGDCEGIQQFCYGSAVTDVAARNTRVQVRVLEALLDHQRLARMRMFHGKQSVVALFKAISGLLFGSPPFLTIEKAIDSDNIAKNAWDAFINNLDEKESKKSKDQDDNKQWALQPSPTAMQEHRWPLQAWWVDFLQGDKGGFVAQVARWKELRDLQEKLEYFHAQANDKTSLYSAHVSRLLKGLERVLDSE